MKAGDYMMQKDNSKDSLFKFIKAQEIPKK